MSTSAAAGDAAGGIAAAGGADKKAINSELWHACAGPLVGLPPAGSLVVYFPQGHSEQVAASMQRDVDAHVPNYPNLPSKLICLLHNVTLLADPETDEVYARMTLQPVSSYGKEAVQLSELALKQPRPHNEFFCKTLTASDTSTHGGFSVPRRAAEKIFPPLDFTMQPPAQELQARDLHDNVWTFRHIYRGQPKRHLLTTGWSLFVSGKRLFAGDSVIFVRDEKQQLLLGIRRANRQPTNISSSVLSSDSMHIGILAAAEHAAANHSPFTVFYNPRSCPTEFVISFAKYQRAVYGNQISLGMRFRMMFETEELGTRRYMGTITGISDVDPVRWKNSQWRNLQVGWDESAAGERRNRVSVWEIEPVVAPFFICPPPFFGAKRPRQPGMLDDDSEMENLFKKAMPWLGEEICIKDPQTQSTIMPGLSLVQWMNMQQGSSFANAALQPDYLRSMSNAVMQNLGAVDISRQLNMQNQLMQQNVLQFNAPKVSQQVQPIDEQPKASIPASTLVADSKPQAKEANAVQKPQIVNQVIPMSQSQSSLVSLLQPQLLIQNQQPQQQLPVINQSQPPTNGSHNLLEHQHLLLQQQKAQQQQTPLTMQQQLSAVSQQQTQLLLQQQLQQQQEKICGYLPSQTNQQFQLSDQRLQLQMLQKLQQQQLQNQQSLRMQPPMPSSQMPLAQEEQKILLDIQQKISNLSSPVAQAQPLPHTGRKASVQSAPSVQSLQQDAEQKLLQKQVTLPDLPEAIRPPTPSANVSSTIGSPLMATAVAQSVLSEDATCSASPSTANGSIQSLSMLHRSQNRNAVNTEKIPLSSAPFSGPLETLAEIARLPKDPSDSYNLVQAAAVAKAPNNATLGCTNFTHTPLQTNYVDTTSSATSIWLSQSDGLIHQGAPALFNQHLFRDAPLQGEIQNEDQNSNAVFGFNSDGQLRIPLHTDPLLMNSINSTKYDSNICDELDNSYKILKEPQQEISSSMVSQSFGGASDMAFNSFDSAVNDTSFLNRNSWAPGPPMQRMRTYTKVYKRGAVGRSIDITRYSGYDDLKRDLARMFSIEGQLEDRQRIGWKLVYKDHEDDILLLGDDPWEEFVNCVRCIRILSPQEVQQMSLEGDLGNTILPNQACSSSDGGNAWRSRCDQNSGNPSATSYDVFE